MSSANQLHRSLDTSGLRRMQDLDKAYFGGGTPRNRALTANPSGEDSSYAHPSGHISSKHGVGQNTHQLPPLLTAWTDTVSGSGGPDALLSNRLHGASGGSALLTQTLPHGQPTRSVSPRMYGAPQRPRTVGNHGGHGQRKAANAKTPRRSVEPTGGLDPILSGLNITNLAGPGATNPWEALVDAAPATRYAAAPARDPSGLQLIMPSGSSREAMLSFEQRLCTYLQPVSGPSGTASVVSGGGGGGGGPRSAAGSPTKRAQSPVKRATTPSKGVASPPRQPGATAAAATAVFMTPRSRRTSSGDSSTPQSNVAQPHAQTAPGGATLPPLVPRTAISTALAAPAPGAEPPWGGAGLSCAHHSNLAELRGGMVVGLVAAARDGGGGGGDITAPAAAVTANGLGEGFGGDATPSTLLGQLMTGRPSNRRQVQLMADWLDSTIGMLWMEQHLASATGPALGGLAAAASRGGADVLRVGTASTSGGGGPSPPALPPLHGVSSPAIAAGDGVTAAARNAGGLGPSGGGGGGGAGKAALAMRFANISAGLRELSTNLYGAATHPHLWASMVEATAAVASSLMHNVAHRCWEEGALLARLWNLHTALLDSGLAAARRSAEQLAATSEEQAAKIRRLDPLIDWELESRATKESLASALEASRAEALLAGRERDALLRENDKIIAHYRRELKIYRSEQRRNAYRLARKLRNTQQQLELMTRDRDILYHSVAYTKAQTANLVELIGGMHGHLRQLNEASRAADHRGGALAAALSDKDFPELNQIEQGLKNILHSVTKVRDVNQDAEDSHFVVEEQVTAVAAADTVGDELVDEVLAEGDPEPLPEEMGGMVGGPDRQLSDDSTDYDSDDPDSRSALAMMAEAALRGSGESTEDDEGAGDYDDDGEGEGVQGEASAVPPLQSERSGQLRDGTNGTAEGAGAGEGGEEEDEAGQLKERRSLDGHSSRSPVPPSSNSPLALTNSGGEEGGGGSLSLSRAATPDVTSSRPRSATDSPAPAQSPSKKKKNRKKGRSPSMLQRAGSGVDPVAADGGGDDSSASPTGEGGRRTSGTSSRHRRSSLSPSGRGHSGRGHRGSARRHSQHHGHEGREMQRDFSFVTNASGTPPLGSPSSSPPPSALPHRRFHVSTTSSQTSPELLRGVADPEIVEGSRQLGVLRGALCELGIMGSPNDDADGTDGLLTALRQYMASLSQEAGTLTKQLEKITAAAESAEAARSDLAQAAEARGREVAAVRRELLEAKKRYSQLCDQLEALGIDPRAPSLPNHGDGDSIDTARTAGNDGTARGAASRSTAKGNRGDGGDGGGGRGKGGRKVGSLAAAKEKARERALSLAASSQAPQLGRVSMPGNPRPSAASGPGSRLQLPAAMLAAAVARAAEAVASGDSDAAAVGGGGIAGGMSAWRSAIGGAAGTGPTPVYIRPDRAAATARLQDALTRYADVKPRTLEWLLKLIDSMYRGKATSDEQRYKIGQEPLTMIEYMFQHLSGQYGTKDLVNQYAAQLVATCLQYCANDPRIGTFQRFLMEEWDTRTLTAYMDATRKLSEPSRVPCCDFPADYVAAGGRKGDSGPVDMRKALWVADRVLMRRSSKAAYVFAQLLGSRAEPITPTELESFFVSPGSYGAELQQARQLEMSRGEFKRLPSAVFLDILCGEYARMEVVFREMLPEIFSQYDADADGWITRQDVAIMVNDMVGDMAQAGMPLPDGSVPAAGPGGAGGAGGAGDKGAAAAAAAAVAGSGGEAERDAITEVLWSALSAAEADARSRADSSLVYPDGATKAAAPGGVVSAAAVTHLSDGGFLEGAFRNDFVRGWVRAFKTGAAQLPGGVGALAEMDLHTAREAARRLLSVLVTRHWAHHGETLEGFFAEAGTLAEQQLKQQAALVEGDMGGSHGDGRDGPRRASALCTVLRLLLVKKADRFSALLTAENLTGGPHNGPPVELEDLLHRLTAAVRLLYGPTDTIWVVGPEMDELQTLSGLDAADVGALPAGYKRWLASVAVRCCALHDRLHLTLPPSSLLPHLQTHRGVPHFARMWRRASAAAVAARRRAAAGSRSSVLTGSRHSMTPGSASATVAATTGSGSGAGDAAPSASPTTPSSTPARNLASSPTGKATMRRPGSGSARLGRPASPARPPSGTVTRAPSKSLPARPDSAPRQRSMSPAPQSSGNLAIATHSGSGSGALVPAGAHVTAQSPSPSLPPPTTTEQG